MARRRFIPTMQNSAQRALVVVDKTRGLPATRLTDQGADWRPREVVTVLERQTRTRLRVPKPLVFFAMTWVPVAFGVGPSTLLCMGLVTCLLLRLDGER